jgi:hypothetical protein
MLLTRVTSTIVANQPGAIALPYELIFEDYRTQDGAAIPFSITERMNGQKTWTITLDSVTTNTGLSDADFAN